MYTIRTEQYFDSAHFLSGYEGKCSNLHGHRWRVETEIAADELREDPRTGGMVADFGDVKRDLSALTDDFDHALIYESGSLREETVRALKDEGFRLVEVPFRTTAENFARYFYDRMRERGYAVRRCTVYETPNNAATYTGSVSP